MIRKANEMIKQINEQMRGGKGSVEVTHLFKQDELNGKARLVARMLINPGCSIGLHEHVNEEEIYYITRGKGQVVDNGIASEVVAGDAVLTGGGASHSIENIGEKPLEMVAVILLY